MRSAEPTPARLQEMSGCICFRMRRAARALTQFYDRALRPYGLRVTQLPILVGAGRAEAVELAPLAEKLGMDRTTLLRNVRPLVRRKLLRVGAASDSRRTEIRVTPAGRKLLARVYPAWERAQRRALEALGPDGAETVSALGEVGRHAQS